MRLVLLVSSDPSDIYFANQLAHRLEVVGVVVEHQQLARSIVGDFSNRLRLLLAPWRIPAHLRRRRLEERMDRRGARIALTGFGQDGQRLAVACPVHTVYGKKAINSTAATQWIRELQPDLIAVCGTSILYRTVLSIPSRGVINVHGGLSQWYRGRWTTHWAIHNSEPECVGATVHFVTSGIDDGDIIYQGRPAIVGHENPEELYVNVVKLGVEMMVAAIGDIFAGTVRRYRVEKKGKLYLSKMATLEMLVQAWDRTERGVIREYVLNKAARDAAVLPHMLGIFGESGSDGTNASP